MSVIAPTNWPMSPVGIGDGRKERINSRRLWFRAQLQILTWLRLQKLPIFHFVTIMLFS